MTSHARVLLLLALVACRAPSPSATPAADAAPAADRYDLLIRNGRVVDGTGAPWYRADLAIRGDRIVRITPPGSLAADRAARVIDAKDQVVAPGFIDIQGQSMIPFTVGDGRVLSAVTQGITTSILGEGWTPAPSNARVIAAMPGDTAFSRAMAAFGGEHGFDAWLRAMERHGISQNVGSFLGATTARIYAKGEAAGTATPAELDTIRAVVRRSMADGAFGIASALIYPPASYAPTEELIAQAQAAAPFGGIYITHMRSEGDRFLEALDEALRIGREGGVPLEIYHLKASGTANWPKMPRAIAQIDSARRAGQDVTADMYLYTAGGTALAACAPPWAAENGKLLDNLRDPVQRAKIRAAMLAPPAPGVESLCQLAGPQGVQVAGLRSEQYRRFEGQRLDAIARELRLPWVDAWRELVLAEAAQVGAIFHLMTEANLPLQIRQPWMKWGTDADGMDPDSAGGRQTHPRTYGNYPRLLGRYVREQQVLPLEEAIRKGTSAVARRLMLPERGQLQPGFFADVIILDPATVTDHATFEQPHQLSTGIRTVIVNGVVVVDEGRHTGARPGRAVRGPGYRPS